MFTKCHLEFLVCCISRCICADGHVLIIHPNELFILMTMSGIPTIQQYREV
jgi:hypothetical protein